MKTRMSNQGIVIISILFSLVASRVFFYVLNVKWDISFESITPVNLVVDFSVYLLLYFLSYSSLRYIYKQKK